MRFGDGTPAQAVEHEPADNEGEHSHDQQRGKTDRHGTDGSEADDTSDRPADGLNGFLRLFDDFLNGGGRRLLRRAAVFE